MPAELDPSAGDALLGAPQHETEERLRAARKIAEDALRANATRFGLVIETQRDVAAAALDLDDVMKLICERTQLVTRAGSAEIVLIRDGELVLGAASGFSTRNVGDRVSKAGTLSGWAFENDESAFCMDTEDDPRIDEATAAGEGTRSMVVVPLRHAGQTVGLIQVMSDKPDCFQIEDLNTLELLSVVLSSAMSHASEFEAKRAQVEALARFEAMVTAAVIGIAVVDRNGRVVETNPALSEILGYGPEELLGRSLNDHAHPGDITTEAVAFDELMHGERDAYRLEKRYYAKSGDLVWAYVAVSPVPDADGNPHVAIEMIEDITQRKLAEEQLREHAERSEHQALHDALTGLPNRVLFQDRIEQGLLQAERDGGRIGVLLLDLDHFKEINDTLGHASGDHVLKEVSARLQACVRASDTVARLGGDEFGLLLPGLGDPAEIAHVLDKLTAAIQESIELEGLPLGIEGSIGVAFYPEHGRDVQTLVKRADSAMYAAKQDNRPYAFFEHPTESSEPTRASLVCELRLALDRGELDLYYQPKARLTDGSVQSVEALLRWFHPERGLTLPDEFIPHAQETGLMKPLTLHVLDRALGQLHAWDAEGLELAVSVNVGTRNLIDLGFPDDVAAALAKWGLPATRLELEITESTVLQDPHRTGIVLDRLDALGIRLSIDDFGTGYSSLAYLHRLPVSEIKIDRSFVTNMEHDEDGAVIVRSTIELGRNLGLAVVAEGVEDAETCSLLAELGCDSVQGFHLSHPLPAAELATWLRSRVGAAAAASR
ncbi:MAG: hypothetical protein QOH73_2677 [Gaiellaceae bacterium]|nr:hypothetical protein [Gaiellaceae bacterium]